MRVDANHHWPIGTVLWAVSDPTGESPMYNVAGPVKVSNSGPGWVEFEQPHTGYKGAKAPQYFVENIKDIKVPAGTLPSQTKKISQKVYIGGALANPEIVRLTKLLLDAGYDAFSEWYTPGKEADVLWRDYEQALGIDYRQALLRPSAQNTFRFDKNNIDDSDVLVMLLPCGKSAHLELGYAIGTGKRGIIYMPEQPDRWDVMYNFAECVVYNDKELLNVLS